MTTQRLIKDCLARAQELEDYAQRLEQNPPSIRVSPRWRDAAFLRREAAGWRCRAQRVSRRTDGGKFAPPPLPRPDL